jgi:hypothetical protein
MLGVGNYPLVTTRRLSAFPQVGSSYHPYLFTAHPSSALEGAGRGGNRGNREAVAPFDYRRPDRSQRPAQNMLGFFDAPTPERALSCFSPRDLIGDRAGSKLWGRAEESRLPNSAGSQRGTPKLRSLTHESRLGKAGCFSHGAGSNLPTAPQEQSSADRARQGGSELQGRVQESRPGKAGRKNCGYRPDRAKET